MLDQKDATKGSILVVDDEVLIRELISDVLSDDGYSVLLASNVDEATACLKENAIDIIFLDIMMPGKTGIEMLEDIKELSPNTLTIIMTAFPSLDYAIEAIKKGVYDFLKKPVGVEEIKLVTRNAMERIRLEDQNKRMMKELKNNVIQLEDLNDRLLELDKDKSEFISNFSYELKTPLTVISGYIDLLLVEESLDKSVINDYLHTIKNEAEKLSSLLHDIIFCSKLEMGKVKPYVESFNIKELMKDVFKSFRTELNNKSIQVSFKTNQDKIMFQGDKNLIAELLDHLVSNAIKFNKKSGKIESILYLTDKTLSLSIKDTGSGISDKDLQRIFDKFYQAEAEEASKSSGLGLGLSIVQEIAALHSGQIYVKSEVGEGTTIKIDFMI